MLLRTCLPRFHEPPSTAWAALLARQTAVLRNGIVTHRCADRRREDVVRDEDRPGNGRNSRFLNPDELVYKHTRTWPDCREAGTVTGGLQRTPGRRAANSD